MPKRYLKSKDAANFLEMEVSTLYGHLYGKKDLQPDRYTRSGLMEFSIETLQDFMKRQRRRGRPKQPALDHD